MKLAVIGANGAVGTELCRLLEGKNVASFSSTSSICFEGIDLAFFCVSKELSKTLIPEALAHRTLCIDASTAFRKDPTVPLVIPEVNGHALASHRGIIASPNCTTTLCLLPLAPLHRRFRIKRIVATTYQAVSGAGKRGMDELWRQTEQVLQGVPTTSEVFPTQCAFNVFLHEAYAEEEEKMRFETQKILEDPTIQVSATCVRVPVMRAHSASLNVEFRSPVTAKEAYALLAEAPGVLLRENATPLDASGQSPIFCGRIRQDHTQPNTLEMWITADQLLKGAALNMVQIAEALAPCFH
jgi:aspartate-semialdehyde dehydrogenase